MDMGCRGTVDTEEQKVKRNSKYRGTVGLEKLRNMGTEEQKEQRRSRHRGTDLSKTVGWTDIGVAIATQ